MTSATIPYHLCVALLGDEPAQDSETLKQVLDRFLRGAREAAARPGWPQLRFSVITTLIGGFERLAAQHLLDQYPGTILNVVLPCPAAECRERLLPPGAVEEFNALLHRARWPIALEPEPISSRFPPEMANQALEQARLRSFRYVTGHCDLLIAQGDPSQSGSGSLLDQAVSLVQDAACPVAIINSQDPLNSPPLKAEEIKATGLLSDVISFHQELDQEKPAQKYPDEELFTLLEAALQQPNLRVSDQLAKNLRGHLIPAYLLADRKAGWYQTVFRRVGLGAFALSFLASLLVALGVTFLRHAHQAPPDWVFLVEALLLMAIIVGVIFADRIRSHQNWMGYRYLAERLRSAFFLALAGVEARPVLLKRHTGTGAGSSGWTDLVFEGVWQQIPGNETPDQKTCEARARFVTEHWIQGQIAYHQKTWQRTHGASHRLEKWGERVFYLALAAAATHYLLSFFHHLPYVHNHFLADGLTLAALALPALGAVIGAVRTHREFKRLARQSQRMEGELKRLKESLRVVSPAHLAQVLGQMESLMIEDTRGWMELVSANELEKAA